ncbi:MAG: Gx transporter family protein [Lachnospiraceae bacterium]|nr:Gx transporter family protein [Lachnospiraceae bacterium]
MKKSFSANRLAVDAMLTGTAMILSYVESLIPLSFAIPGIKMGLANTPVVFALFRIGKADAFFISLLRVILLSALFGTFISFLYSFSGAFTAYLVMLILQKTHRFRIFSVSVTGGVVHNLTQILVAMTVLRTDAIVFYLPSLLIAGIVSGALIGIVSGVLIMRIPQKLTAF